MRSTTCHSELCGQAKLGSAGKVRQICNDIPVGGDLCHLLLADVFRFSSLGLDSCSPLSFPDGSGRTEGAIYP